MDSQILPIFVIKFISYSSLFNFLILFLISILMCEEFFRTKGLYQFLRKCGIADFHQIFPLFPLIAFLIQLLKDQSYRHCVKLAAFLHYHPHILPYSNAKRVTVAMSCTAYGYTITSETLLQIRNNLF